MENLSGDFAHTINTLGIHRNLSSNECENFGMTWGCKTHCPVFESGGCGVPFESIEQFIKKNEIDTEDDFLDYMLMHEETLKEKEIDELFTIWFNWL